MPLNKLRPFVLVQKCNVEDCKVPQMSTFVGKLHAGDSEGEQELRCKSQKEKKNIIATDIF